MSSRKRPVPFRIHNNGVPAPNIQIYQYDYIRPGCYYYPQVIAEVTPYSYTYLDNWQPYCTTATYVVDRFGRTNYPSDFEYQLQVGTSIQPRTREVIFNYYNDGETEISSLPQIEEEDIREDREVSVRKRKRLNNENEFGSETSLVLKKSYSGELCGCSVYRSREGYLVEEPRENNQENV